MRLRIHPAGVPDVGTSLHKFVAGGPDRHTRTRVHGQIHGQDRPLWTDPQPRWASAPTTPTVLVVNPQLHFDRLAATVKQLGVLRQVIKLADRADCPVSGRR